ncbi:MAG: succinate dehydrogenase/fumarate reductase iron-sulfur subunit [Ignavibacteria bacterium]|nr:succinate dehydrogenase/fumarate reductase iron-sulfur subunit [Bacteroidota bacterium]MSQ45514.1 succinate dehydrogenase/fumarate reductase iron-sulfur subunit [Ignavibacteria bacterium]
MKLHLKIWRQENSNSKGKFINYDVDNVSEHMSFLEMLDVLNEKLVHKGEDTISFDHDCREGICGSCGMMINGFAHGPGAGVATCQLHMRSFKDGDKIVIEPFRAKAFPVLKDLVVDRSAFDRILQKGGYISAKTGGIPDGNAIPVKKEDSEMAMDAAACIGCGACVAACPNSSAMLFVSAKVSHLGLLPQGKIENNERVEKLVAAMDEEMFGSCTNTYACEAECPKEISITNITRLNKYFIKATL